MIACALRGFFRHSLAGRAARATALVALLIAPLLGAPGAAETVMDMPHGEEAAVEAPAPPVRFRPGLGFPRAPSDLPPVCPTN